MLDRHLVVARAWFALATAALSITLMAIMPRTAALSPGWQTPIIALELAQTEADVAFLVGPQAAAHREAIAFGHIFDMAFPFAYAGLLLLTLLLSTKSKPLHLAGSLIAAVIVVGDISENLVLLELIERLDVGSPIGSVFGPLAATTWIKWLAIAALVALIGVARWPTAKLKAALCLLLLPLALVAAVARTPLTGELMAAAVVVTIVSFVIGGVVALRRQRASDARSVH